MNSTSTTLATTGTRGETRPRESRGQPRGNRPTARPRATTPPTTTTTTTMRGTMTTTTTTTTMRGTMTMTRMMPTTTKFRLRSQSMEGTTRMLMKDRPRRRRYGRDIGLRVKALIPRRRRCRQRRLLALVMPPKTEGGSDRAGEAYSPPTRDQPLPPIAIVRYTCRPSDLRAY